MLEESLPNCFFSVSLIGQDDLEKHEFNSMQYVYISGKIVPTNCLWVGNVPIDMKRRDFEQTLTRYGPIKSLDYANGDPIAIVTFNEIEDAIKARGKMTGVTRIVNGRKERAEVELSDSTRRGKTKENVFLQSFNILFSRYSY